MPQQLSRGCRARAAPEGGGVEQQHRRGNAPPRQWDQRFEPVGLRGGGNDHQAGLPAEAFARPLQEMAKLKLSRLGQGQRAEDLPALACIPLWRDPGWFFSIDGQSQTLPESFSLAISWSGR